MTRYLVRVETIVTIDVADDFADPEGYGGLLDPARQEGIYNLPTRDAILQHLAYNAVANGTGDAERLDGWADIPQGVLTMDVSVDYTWEPEQVAEVSP